MDTKERTKQDMEKNIEQYGEYIVRLERVQTVKEFYRLIEEIAQNDLMFKRRRGNTTRIYSLDLCDRYGNPFKGIQHYHYASPYVEIEDFELPEDIYVGYLVEDGYSTGKCLLREASKNLYLCAV